jgi:hypothetical protein
VSTVPVVSVWGAYHGAIGGANAFFYARYPTHSILPGLIAPSTNYVIRFLVRKLGGQTVDIIGIRACNDDSCTDTYRSFGSSWVYHDLAKSSDSSGHLYADVGHFAIQIGAAAIVYSAFIAVYDPALPPGGDAGLEYDGFPAPPAAPGALVGIIPIDQYLLEQDEGQTSLGGCYPTSPDSAICLDVISVQPLPEGFPWEIDWTDRFREEREHETTFFVARSEREQRRNLSDVPNRRWSYLIKAIDWELDEFQRVMATIWGGQHRHWWVPYWPRERFLMADVLPGAVSLTVESTLHMGLLGTQAVMLYRNPSRWEIVRMSSLTLTTIAISGTTMSWKGSGQHDKVVPCYRGIMAPEMAATLHDVDLASFQAIFDIEVATL